MSVRPIMLLRSTSGAVAPTVALSLFGLIAAGGIAFDYARLAGLDTELQSAADQAALAAAGQLDGKSGACARAARAASALLANESRFANDGQGMAVAVANETACDGAGSLRFYQDKLKTTAASSNANAKYVELNVNSRTANYAMTPVVQVFSSGAVSAIAFAGVGQAICKQPPVMICNPDEPAGNSNELYPFTVVPGQGVRLVTGDADAPGNFGWLDSGLGNGASALFAALSYDNPPGECQPIDGVTTKTGMVASALNAFNTRFDVFANGNPTCPNGGTCSPSMNSRKDLVCQSNSGATCNNDNWSEAAKPYRPTSATALPVNGSSDPDIMGYPRDLCHALPIGSQTCGVMGNGTWDRDAYFRVNYGWDHGQWTAVLSSTISRYDLYKWELAHTSVQVSTTPTRYKGIGVAQSLSGKDTGFGMPATGRAGIDPLTSPIDRRKLSVAVLNCRALNARGKTTNVPVAQWLDVFLVEPAFNRGQGSTKYTEDKEIYVEVVSATNVSSSASGSAQVVLRSVPYLIE